MNGNLLLFCNNDRIILFSQVTNGGQCKAGLYLEMKNLLNKESWIAYANYSMYNLTGRFYFAKKIYNFYRYMHGSNVVREIGNFSDYNFSGSDTDNSTEYSNSTLYSTDSPLGSEDSGSKFLDNNDYEATVRTTRLTPAPTSASTPSSNIFFATGFYALSTTAAPIDSTVTLSEDGEYRIYQFTPTK